MIGTLLAGLLTALLTGCGSTPTPDPFTGRGLLQRTGNPAASALAYYRDRGETAKADLVARIAGKPTATWLLPEQHPAASVGRVVRDLAKHAAATHRVAVLVAYGIGGRDCGQDSRGGLPPGEYRRWVAAIAAGLGADGASTAVVLEPDSLAQAGRCRSVSARTDEIAGAAKTLADAGSAVYLDGGNSAWQPVATMASRLRAAGVGEVRGFATDVSNYQPLVQERAYADRLSAALGGAHYIVDTSRNGRGAVSSWCNPRDRGLGAPPRVVGRGPEDAALWIKQPGESDGTCNGGPVAGRWWPAAALELAADTAG